MRISTLVWILLVVALLLGALWWYQSPAATSGNQQATSTSTGSPELNGSTADQTDVPIVLSIATSTTLGKYLVASNQMALYRYTKDTAGTSVCTGECASIWRPYLITDAKQPLLPGAGIAGTLSITTRDDGTRQLSYNGMPLYYYRNDARPGDTTGQGVANVWYVVTP
jgi:predicted lipoprotein with Yx(FWY)xxD motif